MKTKQLLEVALKITAFILVLPYLLNFTWSLKQNIDAYMSDSGPDISFQPFTLLALCLLAYFLLFRTEIIVNWIYKEKPEDQQLNININRFDAIFFAVVLVSLYRLSSLIPEFIFAYVESKDSEMFKDLLFSHGAQIAILVIILLSARRIAEWLESYRRRQVKAADADTTTGTDQ